MVARALDDSTSAPSAAALTRRRSMGDVPMGAAAFSAALNTARKAVYEKIEQGTQVVLTSMCEQPPPPEDSDDEAPAPNLPPQEQQWAVRRALDAISRQTIAIMEELSESNAAAHRGEMKALEFAHKAKMERTRRASFVGLQNAGAAAEAEKASALAKQSAAMAAAAGDDGGLGEVIQEMNEKINDLTRKLDVQTKRASRNEEALEKEKADFEARSAKFAEAEAEVAALLDDKAALQESLKALEDERDAARGEAEASASAASQAKANWTEALDANGVTASERDALQAQLAAQTAEAESAAEAHESSSRQLSEQLESVTRERDEALAQLGKKPPTPPPRPKTPPPKPKTPPVQQVAVVDEAAIEAARVEVRRPPFSFFS